MSKKKMMLFAIMLLCANMLSLNAYAESCNWPTREEFKPNGDCETTKRTCCFNGYWSEWGKDCPKCTDMMYGCWNGSACEQPRNLGNCPPEMGSVKGFKSAQCIDGKGWEMQCECTSGQIITFHNDYSSNPQKCKSRSCQSSTHYENLGSVAVGSVCNYNGSFHSGYFFGQSGTVYEACQKAANSWWSGVSKYMNESEIPDNSCRYNGDGSGGMGGYILSKNSSPSSISGSQYNLNCSNTSSYYDTVYCLAFASKRCCDAFH